MNRYEIIRATKSNPWQVIDYVTAADEYEADAYVFKKYGATGYRTVQLSYEPVKKPRPRLHTVRKVL